MVTLLIDGDPIAHAASRVPKEYDEEGFARDEETVEANIDGAIHSIMTMIEDNHDLVIDEYMIFISGKGNFRKVINPEYKANRKDTKYPPMLGYAIEYLNKSWYAFTSHGVEADDTIASTWRSIVDSPLFNEDNDTVIISSIDKDFKTLPCVFFDNFYTRNEIVIVSEREAMRFFYTQLITGDTVDNIKGIPRKGIKAADKALEGIETKFGMRRKVYEMYQEKFRNKARREYTKNHMMLSLKQDISDIPLEFNQLTINQ